MTQNATTNTSSTSKSAFFAAMKQAWYRIPKWKRWMIGASLVLSALAGIAFLLATFVFTGGIAAAVLGGVVAGLSIAAGVTGAITNGHYAVEYFQQGKILRGFFALIGTLSSLLGALGHIFQLANVVGTTAFIGMGVASTTGSAAWNMEELVSSCKEKNESNNTSSEGHSPDHGNDSTTNMLSTLSGKHNESNDPCIEKNNNNVPEKHPSKGRIPDNQKPQSTPNVSNGIGPAAI